MGDLLLPAPSVPSVRFNSLLPSVFQPAPAPKNAKAPSLRGTKSTPHLDRHANNGALSKPPGGLGSLWPPWLDSWSSKSHQVGRIHQERRQVLCARMRSAESYAHWHSAAEELDRLEGNNDWKQDDSDPAGVYNAPLLAQRLRDLDEARTSCDIPAMMHLIRTALSRDLGGMDSVDLYRHSYVGTKKLIERYVESTVATVDAVVTQSALDASIEDRDLLEGMLYSRQSFGRSALLLSGGGTFGMAHVGVVKSLFEAKLLPRIISGASAGSIVCAAACTRTDEELPDLVRIFPYGNLAVFEWEDGRDSVLSHLRRLLTEGSWSDIQHLTGVMRELAGDLTFQEAYNRTRRVLNICVSSASIYELPRLLNYVTAPNVMIWSAVAASCSVPLLFNSPPLLVKDPLTGEHRPWNPTPQRWIDGSVDNDLPMTRLSEMFNVNHFIVSQVNPHIVPFLVKDDYLSPDRSPAPSQRAKPAAYDAEGDWVHAVTNLAKDEALHRLQFLSELGICTNLVGKLRSILGQKYSGDITIIPEMSMHDLPGLLSNPTTEFILRSSLAGEKATWPKLSRIRDRCAIELALDEAVHRLRARVVLSANQRDMKPHHCSISSLHLHGRASDPQKEASERPRRRRQSGGSIPTLSTERPLLDGDDSGGQWELTAGSRPAPAPTQRRCHPNGQPHPPPLRRASKSHGHMPRR